MCPIIDGTPVDAATTNPKFLFKEIDDTTVGRVTLANTLAASGPTISSAQREHNSIASFVGKSVNSVFNDLPAWATSNRGTSGDNIKQRVESIDTAFHPSTGHKHTGAAGDAPQITTSDLVGNPLRGYFQEAPFLTGISGLSTDVSTQLTGESASTGSTLQGIVVNTPYNRVTIRYFGTNDGDQVLTGDGDQVYGRITYSSPVWTLTYYYLDGTGTEQPYSIPSPIDIRWYYQKIYNPITNAPVYDPLAFIPSDNATADILSATTTIQGKVQLATAAPGAIASTGSAGTANATVANANHTHEGVHNIGIFSVVGTPILGDTLLEAGSGVTLSYNSGRIRIESSGSEQIQEVPSGTIDGVNNIFTLTQVPIDQDSTVLYLDDLVVPKSNWSLAGLTITITNAVFIPTVAQTLYVIYLVGATSPPPPPPSGVENVEYRTLTSGEASAKQITLAATPAQTLKTKLDVIGGSAQEYTVDFTVSSNVLSWSGLGLDGFLSTGDKLRVCYFS